MSKPITRTNKAYEWLATYKDENGIICNTRRVATSKACVKVWLENRDYEVLHISKQKAVYNPNID